jgi:hypothetical protein
MSGSTGSGLGPSCEINVMGHFRTHAVQQNTEADGDQAFVAIVEKLRVPKIGEERMPVGRRAYVGYGVREFGLTSMSQDNFENMGTRDDGLGVARID